ncbi:MAG TPA: DUF3631 domain-containing protein [Terriglobia bacterium]|nr:DUF3631 domain-containing protein [Terriglobia bacterium]
MSEPTNPTYDGTTAEFREAMESVGIITQSEIIADDRIHRFHVEGDKPGRKNGWYILHLNPYPVGAFGAWNRDGHHTWKRPVPRSLSREDRAALQKSCIEADARLEAEIAVNQAKARARAKYIWNRVALAPSNHPYLVKKHISPNGAKLHRNLLLLPVRDVEGALHSLQFIGASGEKNFLTGGRVSGCCCAIECPGQRIYVAEGFATGATIHEVTGEAVAVAFNASNLKPVAIAIRKKHPETELVIAADNDAWTDGNPGQAHAFEAAKAVKAKVALPRFRDTSTRPTDFNDLFVLEGAEEVRKQLEPMGLWALLDALVVYFRRFVRMSESQARVIALLVAHTHAFDAADTTPYLLVTSPEKLSGKTRLLEVCETVTANPWLTGRITAAVLTRKIDAERPTLLLDESDAAFSGEKEYAEALRGVLNTGHRRSGKASCCVGQGVNISFRDFSTFCPKVIAGIGKLPDTVANRAIPIRLKRRAPGEPVERFRLREVEAAATGLRLDLQAWAVGAVKDLRAARPTLPEELSDRQQDGAEPLLAIADMAGGQWPEAARKALVELCTGEAAADDSVGVRLLADVREIFRERETDRLASAELAEALARIETSPWSEWNSGKPITQPRLAKLLKPFGIIPDSVRIGDRTPKGYKLEQFRDAFGRYLRDTTSPSPPSETATPQQSNNDAGAGHFSSCNKPNNVAAQETDKPSGISDVADVAVSQPVNTGVAEVQSPPGGDATEEAVAVPPDPVAAPPRGIATSGSRTDTASVASGNSNEGAKQGLLNF